MRSTLYIITGIILFCGCQLESKNKKTETKQAKPVIFDTDFGPDYDDVGAITLLHAFADSGYIDILATVGSTEDSLLAPALDVVNTYFNRPDIPIGVPKGRGIFHFCAQGWNKMLVENYPHNLKPGQADDAVDIYRKMLSKQKDTSVTIITVGFLTNLNDLLKSGADEYTNLNGKQLVEKKVKTLVSMAGKFPEGKEFNVFKDSLKAKYVIEHWPTPIIFSGFEIGSKIKTGLPLINNDQIQNSPVKDVFHHCITGDYWKGDEKGRMSWDQTAVLIAAKGVKPFFSKVKGKFIAYEDGHNEWQNNNNGNHYYVKFNMPVDTIKKIINNYMMHEPATRK